MADLAWKNGGMAAKKIDVFPMTCTQAVCDVLAQTNWPGLTNSEIDHLLTMVNVQSREDGANKRDSLYRTLNNVQVQQQCGNVLAAFIARAMDPTRYTGDPQRRAALADALGPILALQGFHLGDDGHLVRGPQAKSLSEAAKLSGSLRAELVRRNAHSRVLEFCSEELIAKSLFHAMSEAAKSIPAQVRKLTGSTLDGAELYDEVLGSGTKPPVLMINDYVSQSDISEQKGFKQILVGIHGHYRNPRAHTTRLGAVESEQDLLDAFSLFSYVHRRLDQATVKP